MMLRIVNMRDWGSMCDEKKIMNSNERMGAAISGKGVARTRSLLIVFCLS